ncbi:MAG: ABC transporter substrate-binding protein [Actinomycetota bacterium]|nr:ABC transporter substrate-binding protein [Actinomycetota bacterium]
MVPRQTIASVLIITAGFVMVAPAEAAETTVRIPLPRDPGNLTPLTFTLGYPFLTLVYDTVTWRDRQGTPRPWLARSVRTAGGGRRVIVRLRDGLRWHDGRALTARDVAFTYDFMRERRHPRFSPQLKAIASVRARDRRTVEFRLRHPAIGFADQPLADVPILPEHLWRGLGPGLRAPAGAPVGSGPYRYAGRRADGGFRLVAVREYFRGRPRAGRIEVPIIPDSADTLDALQRGTVDALPIALTPGQLESVESSRVRVARGSLYLGTMLVFNVRRPPFDRVEVRRAVAAALDQQRIARAVGSDVPATTGPLHPRSPWAPQRVALAPPTTGVPLAALGLQVLRVLAPAGDPVRREAGRQVVLGVRRAGGAARLVALGREQLARALDESGGNPDFDLSIATIPALASQDPDFLATVFGPPTAGAASNRSGYASPAFDRLAARVAAAPSVTARRQSVTALLAQLARDVPAVPLFFSDGAFAYRSPSPVGWTFVTGSGIVDKQSFLRKTPDRAPAGGTSEGDVFETDNDGIGLSAVLAAGGLALILIVGGVAVVRLRR